MAPTEAVGQPAGHAPWSRGGNRWSLSAARIMLIAAFTEVTGRAAFRLVGSVNCHFGHVNFGED